MPAIRVLPDMLVKKIAAGEVIERPASVVKELMENAVDAGARRIVVAVEDGGRSLIRVTDDGCGMSLDDLRLSVTPHATSKLHDEDDLYAIGSLGFRGEALASIGAVSRLRIVSRTHEADTGGEIVVQAEQVHTRREAGCPPGTTIEIRDLFFNVPARRKFLRQSGTEFGHVNTQFARVALAHPNIVTELINNGRHVQQLPATDSKRERIGKFYSRELGDSLIEVRCEDDDFTIEGYAAPPAGARSSANWQFTFLNGRYIRDRYVQHAIKEAYRGLIDPHRFPVIFLFLSINPAAVDVNVHPTKIEVRWQESNRIHAHVLSALRDALRSADLTPSLSTERGFQRPPPDPAMQQRLRSEFAEQIKNTTPSQPSIAFGPQRGASGSTVSQYDTSARQPDFAQAADLWRNMYPQKPLGDEQDVDLERASPPSDRMPPDQPTCAIQLHNTYLVCETDDGMVIIDQHALHERILYEQLKRRITAGKLESQRLLLPETLQVTPARMALLETQADLFDRLGLELSPFGPDTVAVQSFPALLKDTDVAAFVGDLLDTLEQSAHEPHAEEILERVLSMMACKAAVKAGDPLTGQEIEALVSRKELVENSSNCPHGRPTTLRLTVKDLERQFKRT